MSDAAPADDLLDPQATGPREGQRDLVKKSDLVADEDHLSELRAQRAIAAAAKLQKQAAALAEQLAGVDLKELPAAAKKKDKTLDASGTIAVVLNGVLLKAGAKPDSMPVIKALKKDAPALAKVVSGDAGQAALLDSLQSWMQTDSAVNTDAKMAKGVHLLYEADVLEEEVCLKWWSGLEKSLASAKRTAGEAQRAAEEAAAELAEATEKLPLAEQKEKEEKKHAAAAKKEQEYAKCGNGANKEEELREKTANQALRKAQAALALAENQHTAARKKKAAAMIAKETADKELKEKAGRAEGLESVHAKLEGFFTWLAEAEEDEDDDEDDE